MTHGQAAPASQPQSESSSPAAVQAHIPEVAPDDPVITVNDFCPNGSQPDGVCKTVVTRAQFEKLTEALQPGMALPTRLKVANAYAQMMRMADVAEKQGLDKTPAFAEETRYARMQLLSQDLNRTLQEEANNVSDSELEDYYQKNESSFEEATVARIFVPHTKQLAHSAKPDETQQKVGEEEMTKLAADLREHAANGEDPDKLQAEAYAAAGVGEIAPNTRMEKARRTTLPPQHESVMELKAGEVSQVFSDPGGAHFIYKMIGKHVLTLEEAKAEIRTQISTQRFRDSMKPFQGNAVFSDAYFNPPGASTTPPHRNPKDRRSTSEDRKKTVPAPSQSN